MKKTLLTLLGGACLMPAAYAQLTVGEITLPQNVAYGETADLKIEINNEGETLSDYKVEVLRGFTSFVMSNGTKTDVNEDYVTLLLATVEGETALENGKTEISVPVTFELGGDYDLIVRVVGADGETVEGKASATLTVEGADSAKSYELTMPSADIDSFFTANFSVFNGMEHIGDQCIYPALTDLPRNAIINTLTYYYKPSNYPSPQVRYRVYMGMIDSDVLAFTSKTPISEGMTLVYDGISPECPKTDEDRETAPRQEWVLPLGVPFVYDPSKNLVITIEGEPGEAFSSNSLPWFVADKRFVGDTTDELKCGIHANWWQDGDFFSSAPAGRFYTDNIMPKVKLSYQLEKEAEVIDLAIEGVTLPEGVKAGDPATFRVMVNNIGTAAVESFTIELLDVANGIENAQVIASAEIDDPLGASGETNEKIRYTFEAEGEYQLAVRVVVPGEDIDEENNVSDIFDFHVGPAVGVEAVGADSNVLGYADGVIRAGAGEAAMLSVASADGRIVMSEAIDGNREIPASLSAGVYVARLATASGKTYIAKFIVR
ncbi:MAG: hypothetical protein HDS82_05130 [Bacteroidales bacterium]|nr:hypothetical protein [Bacteroidales bacterium]